MTCSVFAGTATETLSESDVEIKVSMRNHGYTLGDLISMHVEFTIGKGYEFDSNSVPLKGPINAWLDLRDVVLQKEILVDERELIQIDFTWQLFGSVAEAQIINIPSIIVQTLPVEVAGNDKEPLIVIIPEQGVYLSPVLPEQITEQEAQRPIIVPPKFDEMTLFKLAWLCLALGLLLFSFWLWLQDKIKWLPRKPGAMTLLARQLHQQRIAKQAAFNDDDLRMIHAGLAGCAGQSLYPDTLDKLFESAPYLLLDKEAITHFFTASWQAFHRKDAGEYHISVADTMAWVKRSAISERLFRQAARQS
ncbi:MAG: hypothetical protein PSN44_05340 [Gammaproteobacteria bacterium]|nr:hypothetical protein [Gammaproteobacteria bacterium]